MQIHNQNALSFFGELAANSPDARSTKFYTDGRNDFTDMDAAFILQYVNKKSLLLDVATGPGLIIGKIYTQVGSIVAVEKYESFTQHIVKSPNISIVHCDIKDYTAVQKFDVITMFGIMQYFNEKEAKVIYKRYFNFLAQQGKVIIKNQFGIAKDVVVAGFSKDLNKNYFSEYRHIDKEVQLLEEIGFKNVSCHDIYPPECSRWDNTHYYAIVAER